MPNTPDAAFLAPLAGNNYVMMLAMKEQNSSTGTFHYSSAFAGHGLLLIHITQSYNGSQYFIFHLSGWGGVSSAHGCSDSPVIASSINTRPVVCHFVNTIVGGTPSMRGNAIPANGYNLSLININSYVNFKTSTGTVPSIVCTAPWIIDPFPAQILIQACMMSEYSPNVKFSLTGGIVNWGENCVAWVYNQLGMIGVGFDNVLYRYSFFKPWSGVFWGGQLGIDHISTKR